MSILPSSAGADGGLSWQCLSSNPFINPFIKMLKIPLLVSLGHHGGQRKVASLRPPFSTPLRSLGEPDPDTPFLVPIEHAPPLFVRIWEDKISLKIPPPPLSFVVQPQLRIGVRRLPGLLPKNRRQIRTQRGPLAPKPPSFSW